MAQPLQQQADADHHTQGDYLDATGGLWRAQVGHGRREIAEAAATQMRRREYFMSFWEFSNERTIELVADRQTRTPLAAQQPPQDVIRRETGVIVRDCGHNLVLSPPLTMTNEEADTVADAVELVLRRLQPDGSYTG